MVDVSVTGPGIGDGGEQLAATIRELQQEMAGIEETAESEDGLIVATVGVRGRLVSLEIDPRVYRVPDAPALATSIVETIRSADDKVERKSVEIAKKMMPEDDDPEPDPAFGPVLYELDRLSSPGGGN